MKTKIFDTSARALSAVSLAISEGYDLVSLSCCRGRVTTDFGNVVYDKDDNGNYTQDIYLPDDSKTSLSERASC
jgi:hypothetical protein